MYTPMVKLLRPLDPYEPQLSSVQVSSAEPGERSSPSDETTTWAPPRVSSEEPEPDLSQQWLRFFLNAVLETQTGVRALPQLRRFLDPRLYRKLEFGKKKPGAHLSLGSLQVCRPAPTIAEVCATVRSDTRAFALAARLEHTDGDWNCVAFSTLDGDG